jgi:phage recombination protein Bet
MARNNNNRENQNQVAVIQPPRMQMPANVREDYGIDADGWRALTDAVFPSAKTVGAVVLALSYCKRQNLDIFQRPVHIVPIYMNGRTMESVWPGIGLLRIIAQRQGDFAGYDDCEFGEDITETFKGTKDRWENNQKVGVEKFEKTVTYPEWAQFTVYKFMNGQRIRMPGPKVYWRETYAMMGKGNECPNEMWEKRPRGQIEKCAEAAALRRAFPDVLGNEYAAEEMEGRNIAGAIEGQFVEVDEGSAGNQTASTTSSAKPKRSDYRSNDQRREEVRDTGHQVRDEEGQREEPEQEEERPDRKRGTEAGQINPLDGDDIPGPDQWGGFIDLLRARLEGFVHVSQVDQEQAAQQFRIDMAPPAIAAEALELFTDAANRLDQPAKDGLDQSEQGQNGGTDEA